MEQLTQILQNLADQLGVTTQYLWPYLVRWTFANHLSALITNLVICAVSAVFFYLSTKVLRGAWGKDMGDDSPSRAFFEVVVGICGMILFPLICLITLFSASDHIAGVFVPEAQSIIDILAKITPKK